MNPTIRLAELVIKDPARASMEAIRLLAAHKAKRQRVAAKSKPRRADEDRAKELAVVRHKQLVRAAVMRAEERCELCGDSTVLLRTELHHLEHGSAKSRDERMSNVMIVHPHCHQSYHLNVSAFVDDVKKWCSRYGYPLPNRREYR
jgi:hypothetical protein